MVKVVYPLYKDTSKLLGQRFGRLVVDKFEYHKYSRCWWSCVCDCGARKIVSSNMLLRGHVKSCGCYKRDLLRKSYGEGAYNIIARIYINSKKLKGVDYNLTEDLLKILFSGDCYYCGLQAKDSNCQKGKYGDFYYNGIDRIDNHKGYISDNVVSCCKHCNYAKRDMSQKDFLDYIKRLYNNYYVNPNKSLLENVGSSSAQNRIVRSYNCSRNKKLGFNLSREVLIKFFISPCFYCGIASSNCCSLKTSKFHYNGIDRVNNDIGYTESNCVSCCIICNKSKRKRTQTEFLSWVTQIYNKHCKIQDYTL